jgi:hypothetical protein
VGHMLGCDPRQLTRTERRAYQAYLVGSGGQFAALVG